MASSVAMRDLLTLALLAITAGTSVYAAVESSNYLQLYPTLSSMELALNDFRYDSDDHSLNATAAFVMQNPSGYKGLSLTRFQSFLDILLNGTEQLSQGSIKEIQYSPAAPLNPGSRVSINFPFNGALMAPLRVTETRNAGGEVRFVFDVSTTFTSLLDRFGTVAIRYSCEATWGPGMCVITEIRILIRGGSGGGGV